MNRVYLLLGSNIDKERNLPAAVRLLARRCQVVAVSSVYETLAVGAQAQENYFNAAVLIHTPLTALKIKQQLIHPIEQALQRRRTADKFAPRTIDLDIVLFNDDVFVYDGRQIPDPDLLQYAHVVAPVAELAPDMRHPQTAERLADIAARLRAQAEAEQAAQAMWQRPDVEVPF